MNVSRVSVSFQPVTTAPCLRSDERKVMTWVEMTCSDHSLPKCKPRHTGPKKRPLFTLLCAALCLGVILLATDNDLFTRHVACLTQ